MKQVFITANLQEAHMVKGVLEMEGIESTVVGGDYLGLANTALRTDQDLPSVWIRDDAEDERAEKIIGEWRHREIGEGVDLSQDEMGAANIEADRIKEDPVERNSTPSEARIHSADQDDRDLEASTGLQLATRSSRLGAAAIDHGILLVLLSPVSHPILYFYSSFDGWIGLGDLGILALFGLVVFGFVQVYFLTVDGQTLGKKALGIRIVDIYTNKNDGFVTNVFLRSWVNGILSLIPFYSLLDALFIFGEDRRCIHDHIADTRVVMCYPKN